MKNCYVQLTIGCLAILGMIASSGCAPSSGSSGGGGPRIRMENIPPPEEVVLSSGITAYSVGTIDSSFRTDTGIAINSQGEAHLLFTGRDQVTLQSTLNYVTNENAQWRLIKQWGRGQTGRENGIAVDANDRVHIISESTAGSNEDLTYATNASGTWRDSTLDNGSSLGLAGDIWIDPIDGSIHISHWQWTSKDLRYTTNVSGSWENFIVGGGTWNSTSMFTDSFGEPHIVYRSGSNVAHVTNFSGELVRESIGLSTSSEVSAAIDPNDNIWIFAKEGLAFQSANSSVWVVGDPFTSIPYRPTEVDEDAFTIDSDGSLHLCFSVFSSQDRVSRLVYVRNKLGSWQHAVIDSVESDFGSSVQPSIAVGQGGFVHIVFVDPDQSALYTSFDPNAIL